MSLSLGTALGLSLARRRAAGGNGAALTYLLRATWDSAADQGYTDAQILNTEGEGVEDGELTIVEVDGSLDVVSNELDVTGQSTGSHGDLGFYSQVMPQHLGMGLLATLESANLSGYTVAMFKQSASTNPTATGGQRYSVQLGSTGLRVSFAAAGGQDLPHDVAINTPYQVAIVWGGYDTNGNYYYSGRGKGTHYWGASFFIKGGAHTDWTLVYRTDEGSSIRPDWWASFSKYTNDAIVDDWLVPNADLSPILDPANLFLSLFEAANGTSLDVYTPDSGGGWTEQSGDWEIQGNAAKTASVSGAGIATYDAGVTDYIIEATVTIPSSGTTDAGIICRYVDANNYWEILIERSLGRFRLNEINGGTLTTRINATQTWTADQTYRLRIQFQGALWARLWVDGAVAGTYDAANTLGENSTLVGLFDDGDDNMTFEDIALFPATGSSYDDRLDLTTTSELFPELSDLSDDFDDNDLGTQWSEYIESGCTIDETGGQLEFTTGTNHAQVTTEWRYLLTGDFDVQVDFVRDTTSGWISLRTMTPTSPGATPEEEARVIFRDTDGIYGFEVRHDSLPGTLDGTGTYVTVGGSSGKFRITRSGTTVEGFYWDSGGAQWVSIDTGTVDADDFGIILWMTESADGHFDNLVVNSGTVVRGF